MAHTKLAFTKMQGAGNDFVVLDATQAPLALSREQLRHLGDRRFGVGADQILAVEAADAAAAQAGIQFRYRIFNGASGNEVEHCGNGARCFLRFVHEQGLTTERRVRVATVNQVLELVLEDDGRVTVDMSRPVFAHEEIPFDPGALTARLEGGFERWPLEGVDPWRWAVLSMGNPHAVTRVDDVASAPVAQIGPLVERHPRFPNQVNVGFLQVVSRREVKLRVHERDAGETLACGTGACAAVVAGIRLGWLDGDVEVHTRGGALRIRWAGGAADSVFMTGPAETVYRGEIEL
ncbi:MAG: diaminopimelate epimerase [Rubrivivax sp.]|nr:diaminopimelate epimerase [Rubrivivax sp.]